MIKMAVSQALHDQLCLAAPRDIRRLLDRALTESPDSPSSLTKYILEFTQPSSNGLPLRVWETYLRTSKDPQVIVAGLNQSHNAACRYTTIRYLDKPFRSATGFHPTWDALGGPSGIAALMKRLDLNELGRFCRVLGDTYRSLCAREEREREMSKLLRLLCDLDPEKAGGTGNRDPSVVLERDPRGPELRAFYEHIVKACSIDVCDEWVAGNWYHSARIYIAHSDVFRDKIIQKVFNLETRQVRLRMVNTYASKDYTFSYLILRKLVCDDIPGDWEVDAHSFKYYVFLPLVNHLKKRDSHVASSSSSSSSLSTERLRFWEMVLTCFKKFPSLTSRRYPYVQEHASYSILKYAVHWWHYRCRELDIHAQATEVLQSLFEQILTGRGSPHDFDELLEWLRWVKVGVVLRSELLRIFLRHPKIWGFDIESPSSQPDESLKEAKGRKFKVTVELLDMLPPETAVRLLNFAAELDPYHEELELVPPDSSYHPSILSKSKDHDPDTLLVRAYFQSRLHFQCNLRDKALNALIQAELTERMERAKKNKPLGERPDIVKSALLLSVARGSLQGYSDMLRWASQFDDDGTTANTAYSRHVVGTREGINLLCGIPTPGAAGARAPQEVGQNIQLGNRVLQQLLDAVALATRVKPDQSADELTVALVQVNLNPSPNKPKKAKDEDLLVEYVGILPSDVVIQRLRHVNSFQSYWKLSDEEVYKLVWEPTLEMLLSVERFALHEDNKHLGHARKQGMIRPFYGSELRRLSNSTWRFFDNLAKERDELWRQKRLREFGPATDNIPSPQGLPVQFLLPSGWNGPFILDSPLKLPYVESRAMEVLFSGKQVLLDTTRKKGNKGGPHDEFQNEVLACIRICVSGQDPKGPKDINDRVYWLWDHVVEKLTGFDGMSRRDVVDYWKWDFDGLFTKRRHQVG